MRRLFPVLGLVAVLAASRAQAQSQSQSSDDKRFMVRPYFLVNSIEVTLGHGDGPDLDYESNSPLALGGAIAYRDYELSGALPLSPEDVDSKGRAKFLDFHLGHAFKVRQRELVAEAFFSTYKGLYLTNTHQVEPEVAGNIIRPDLRATMVGASASYYFNRDFSYDDVFSEFRRRPRSSGSFAVRLAAGVVDVIADDALVTPAQRSRFGAIGALTHERATYTSLSAGYAYALWWRGFFLGGGLLVGATGAYQRYWLGPLVRSGLSVDPSVAVRVALGWAGQTWHTGVTTGVDLESLNLEGADLEIQHIAVIIAVGARF
jgi:hypothetical protein